MARNFAAKLREKLASGALPNPSSLPTKYFVGRGTNGRCDGCEEFITPDQIESEINHGGRTLRFHARCLAEWHAISAESMYEVQAPVRGDAARQPFVDLVRDKLDSGLLPHDGATTLWAGIGSGRTCSLCEAPILITEMEYELEYDDGRRVILFHVSCHGLWEAERRRRGYAPPD